MLIVCQWIGVSVRGFCHRLVIGAIISNSRVGLIERVIGLLLWIILLCSACLSGCLMMGIVIIVLLGDYY